MCVLPNLTSKLGTFPGSGHFGQSSKLQRTVSGLRSGSKVEVRIWFMVRGLVGMVSARSWVLTKIEVCVTPV